MDGSWPNLVGGNAALDFANTGLAAAADPLRDVLADLDVFVAWSRYASIHPGGTTSPPSGKQAAAILREARLLRTAIVDVMSARADGAPPPARALAQLHQSYSAAIADARPSLDAPLTWSWAALPAPLAVVRHLGVQAVQLLQAPKLDRLKACAACRFLFLDASRNNSRRWCSMETCGTQVKARRFVERRAAARRSAT
jgi:predicted RNA-binding Zn ribbon-like protein